MWESIQSNKRKSLFLFIIMGVCLVLLGYFIGSALFSPDGGISGLFIALAIWVLLSFLSYFSGDKVLLAISRAKEVSHDVHPQLFNVV
jgi:heat shock protein HtpX